VWTSPVLAAPAPAAAFKKPGAAEGSPLLALFQGFSTFFIGASF